jgi:hypothetical protein
MKTAQTASPSSPRTHTTLSPRTNLILICIWALVVFYGFVIVQPRLPFTLALAGGLCGALAGGMQHLSIKHDPHGFVAASSLMGVRRALTNTAWGRKYIAWLYLSKFALVLFAFLLLKGPLYRVLLGYLTAYFSLMLVRDVITLKDTFALSALRNSGPSTPEMSA